MLFSTKKNSAETEKRIPKALLPMKKNDNNFKNVSENFLLNRTEKIKKIDIYNEKTIQVMNQKLHCTRENSNNLEYQTTNDSCLLLQKYILKERCEEKIDILHADEIVTEHLFFKTGDYKYILKGKLTETVPLMLPFPKISHVNESRSYKSFESECLDLSNLEKCISDLDSSKMKTLLNLNNFQNLENFYKCKKLKVDSATTEIESYCKKNHIMFKYPSMISNYEIRENILKKSYIRSNSQFLQGCYQEYRKLNFPFCWTEKYKPKCSAEVIGNEEAASKLKIWLENWTFVEKINSYSSSEEFSNPDNMCDIRQVAVLIGPYGSGKTACAYAVAEELGYKYELFALTYFLICKSIIFQNLFANSIFLFG